MKKLIAIIATTLLCVLGAPAQQVSRNISLLISQSESAKESYGENSDEYLASLDSIVQSAFEQQKYDIAFKYRNIHIDIIANKEGTESLNYAIDLSRLGNVSSQLHPNNLQIAIDYHLKAYKLFDKLKAYDHIFYLVTTGQLSNLYANTGQYSLALQYQDKHLMCIKKVESTSSISYLNACNVAINIADAAKSNDLIDKYSREILQNTSKLTNENFAYYQFAISAKHAVLWRQERYQDAIKTIIDYLDRINSFWGDNNSDYVSGLTKLAADYMCIGKYQECIDASLKAINIIEVLCNGDKTIMLQHKSYYDACNTLSAVYEVTPNQIEEFKYEREVFEILKATGKVGTDEYIETIGSLFKTAVAIGENSYVISIADEVEKYIQQWSSEPQKEISLFYGSMYQVSADAGQYDNAIKYLNKRHEVLPKIYNGDDLFYRQADNYKLLSGVYHTIGDNANAKIYLSKAESDLENITLQNHRIVRSLRADILVHRGAICEDYNYGISCLSQALLIYEDIEKELLSQLLKIKESKSNTIHYINDEFYTTKAALTEIRSSIAYALSERGQVYGWKLGKYSLAYEDFSNSAKIYAELKSINSRDYIVSKNNIAICEMYMGKYTNAIKTLDSITDIVRKEYGMYSDLFAMCLLNYGMYYNMVLDYQSSINATLQAKEIYHNLYGDSSQEYITILANLGQLYININDNIQAEENLSLARSILEQDPNKDKDLIRSTILQNLAIVYCKQGKYKEADKLFKSAETIVLNVCGNNSLQMADLLSEYGRQCTILRINGADLYIGKALNILIELGMNNTSQAVYYSLMYGLSSVLCEQLSIPQWPQISMDILKEYYRDNFTFFIEEDRARVWDILQNYKSVLFSLNNRVKITNSLYDYCLFSKSLLLTTSANFGKAVMNSGNDSLIAHYNRLQVLKKKQMTQSSDTFVDEPTTDVARLEREIISQLKQDKNYAHNLNYTVSDIVKALGKNEIAIEFVDYTNLKTDKTEYAALILRKGWKEPQFIPLFEEGKIDAFIKRTPKEMYSNSYVGKQLYKLIWAPISEYINDGEIVYFSPAGKLYTVAMESLCTQIGVPMAQLYNMIRVTSTREVCMTETKALPQSAIIYGGLQYDATPSQMAAISRSMGYADTDDIVFTNDSDTRAGWGYLEGTKKEAEYIAELMKQSQITHKLYSGEYGNEESFKSLSGENLGLIHLATHGFFMPNQTAKQHTFVSMIQSMGQPGQPLPDIVNPMLRAGLLFAGGNNVWTGVKIDENIEDGILTAAEISAMNLRNTDIVVLSACETGLGEISSDGVFGLQRAFKQAGVKTLIMSLWRVDDAATELMMKTFYENLLAGKSKREAFSIAQNTVRNNENFTNPHYWAGFIMLD